MPILSAIDQSELLLAAGIKVVIGSAIAALFLMLAVWIVARIRLGYGKAYVLVFATYALGTIVFYLAYFNGVGPGPAVVGAVLVNFVGSVYLYGTHISYPGTVADPRMGDLGYPKAALAWLLKIAVPVLVLIVLQLPTIINELSR